MKCSGRRRASMSARSAAEQLALSPTNEPATVRCWMRPDERCAGARELGWGLREVCVRLPAAENSLVLRGTESTLTSALQTAFFSA